MTYTARVTWRYAHTSISLEMTTPEQFPLGVKLAPREH